MKQDGKTSCILVIFGGTGDLTHRKLLSALYDMRRRNMVQEDLVVISAGRREKTADGYREEACRSVEKHARYDVSDENLMEFSRNLHYVRVDFEKYEDYKNLESYVNQLKSENRSNGNMVFYLAVAPDMFDVIISNLNKTALINNEDGAWKRLIIEKPFGSGLMAARQLNKKITEVFGEENTFRIDHYLGKEMVQSIMGIRFANVLFEPLWNAGYIDNIQITISEEIGIENRGDYYENAGAMGDMVQNHMLQILALIAMEPPLSFNPDAVRNEKVKVLDAIPVPMGMDIQKNIVFGQYSGDKNGQIAGYRQENKVSEASQTETFFAMKLELDLPRWRSVPVYMRTGKRLKIRSTMVVLEFKTMPYMITGNNAGNVGPNLLIIRIQPKEEVLIQFNTKKPGIIQKICPVKMSYCQNCEVCQAKNQPPDSYEKLLHDVIMGDSTLFTRWDEVERSWEIIEALREAKKSIKFDFPNYKPGSWGPQGSDELLNRDGRRWWNLEEEADTCEYGTSL